MNRHDSDVRSTYRVTSCKQIMHVLKYARKATAAAIGCHTLSNASQLHIY